MNVKQILFTDLIGRDLVGCWVEDCCVGNSEDLGNTRFRIKAFQASSSDMYFDRLGKLKYDPVSNRWEVESENSGRDHFFCWPAQDFYTGPFEFDTGEVVWLFGSFDEPYVYTKLYPKGYDPSNAPIKFEEFMHLAREFC